MFDPYAWGLSCHFTRLMGKACPVAQWPRESRGSDFVAGKNPCKMHITQMHMSAPALHSLLWGEWASSLLLITKPYVWFIGTITTYHAHVNHFWASTPKMEENPVRQVWVGLRFQSGATGPNVITLGYLCFPLLGMFRKSSWNGHLNMYCLWCLHNDVNFFGHRNGRLKNMVTSLWRLEKWLWGELIPIS